MQPFGKPMFAGIPQFAPGGHTMVGNEPVLNPNSPLLFGGPTMPQPGMRPNGGIPGANTIPDASRFVPPAPPGIGQNAAQAALNQNPAAPPAAPQTAMAPSFAQPGIGEMFASKAYQDAMGWNGMNGKPKPRRNDQPLVAYASEKSPAVASEGAPATQAAQPQREYSDSVYGATQNYHDNQGAGRQAQPSVPGSGVGAFVGNNGLQLFKDADVQSNWQGPVLPHENTGKHVGYIEGSAAHHDAMQSQAGGGIGQPGSPMAALSGGGVDPSSMASMFLKMFGAG